MTRRRDREHPLQAEVPFHLGIQERQDETAGSGVHVDRNFEAGLLIVSIERLVERLDIVVQTRPGNALNRYDTDRVLVAHGERLLGIERRVLQRQRHGAQFDLPKLAELLPHHLETGAHHQIRFVERFARSLATLAPAQPRGHTAQHTCLRRADTEGACLPLRLLRSIPKIGDHVDTASIHNGNAGILRFVDIVYTDCFIHKSGSVFVHVGSHERRQIQPGLSLGISFIFDDLICNFRAHHSLGITSVGAGSSTSFDPKTVVSSSSLFRFWFIRYNYFGS